MMGNPETAPELPRLPRYTNAATARRLAAGRPVPHELIGWNSYSSSPCPDCGRVTLLLHRGDAVPVRFNFEMRCGAVMAVPHAPGS
jgi:hypothetical protein